MGDKKGGRRYKADFVILCSDRKQGEDSCGEMKVVVEAGDMMVNIKVASEDGIGGEEFSGKLWKMSWAVLLAR
jgi:hypothetical protein